MNRIPSRQKPIFRALVCFVVLAATWIYGFMYQDGWQAGLAALVLDLILIFLLLQACLFFYSQFTLPIRTLQDRLRIWARVLLHARNAHGPAIFIQNGRKVERRGESNKRGPALLWIDTASAATTHAEGRPKQVLGPGIHFIDSGERLEATFSLHTQTYTIGPGQDEAIFDRRPEEGNDEARGRFATIQAKRQSVSGLTRDGNEVVPEIRVVFRLDASPVPQGVPGSRFGFSRESVERAARSEGVNVDPVSARRLHVSWNQLPGLIAVDLWREYLGKFTLDDLFSARFGPLPEILQPEEPVPPVESSVAPLVVRHDWPAPLLKRVNNSLEHWLRARGIADEKPMVSVHDRRTPPESRQVGHRDYTALQLISHMVKARMTQQAVPNLDECGRYLKGHILSEEYRHMRERGLRILDVTLGGYRFDPAVEEQIVQQWRTAWHANATGERAHVEQLEVLAMESGKQMALLEHAKKLAGALQSEPTPSIPSALKILLHASHAEILTDERLHGRGTAELASLTELSKWLEAPGD